MNNTESALGQLAKSFSFANNYNYFQYTGSKMVKIFI